MRHGSLFSGIGGFDLAASWLNWENIFQIEIDNYCQKLLNQNFINVTKYKDIKEFDGTKYRGIIDILTGGFPCQGFSVAGKQRGKSDSRWLWPEMLRVIREIRLPWVVGENVPGIINLALEDICLALEGEGYEVQPFIIPSASIGAWDKRDRVWIIAYNHQFRCNNEQKEQRKIIQNKIRINETSEQSRGEQQCGISQSNIIASNIKKSRIRKLSIQQRGQNETGNADINGKIEVNPDIKGTICKQSRKTRSGRDGLSNSDCIYYDTADIISRGLQRHSGNELSGTTTEQERPAGQANWSRPWIEVASELCRSNARVPHRMDRIKALGNSVNPYVVLEIFKAIEQYELRDRT